MTPNPSAAPDAATAEVNPAAVVDKAPPWSFLRYFLSGSTLVLVLFGGLFFADYEWANEAVRVREQSNVEMMDAIVRQDMETVLGDIVYLSGSASRLYDRPTAVGELPQTLPWLLLNFVRAKRIYGSVAFVDPGGKEAIRIDLDEGGATVADPVGLRDLSHVSYIPDAGALQPNEVVISDFHGRVPITDDDGDERYSIAVGKAVYDGNGQLRGQIVLDYRAKAILDRLRRVEQQVHSRAILLNADGAWIYGGTAEDGKSLDFPMSFAQQRSDMWAQLKEVEQGQIQRGNRLSTFATIRPLYGIGQLAERTGVTLVHGTRRRDPDAYHWKLLTEADVRPSHLVPLLGDPRVYVLLAAVLVGVAWVSRLFAASEAKRHQATVALHRKQEELLRALDHEKAVNTIQKNFIWTISHEFRSPLAIIDSSAQMLARRGGGGHGPGGERLESIRAAVTRINALIDQILSAARAESDRLTLHPQPCDIAELIADVADEQTQVAPGHVILCRLDPPRRPLEVDPVLIRQVLGNLLSNAVKYSPQAERVTVTGRSEDEGYAIMVRDEGVGIPADELEHVFERFYRASTARGIPGTGLGLDLVRNIVAKHGGSVEVESAPEAGTTFRVRLPWVTPSIVADDS